MRLPSLLRRLLGLRPPAPVPPALPGEEGGAPQPGPGQTTRPFTVDRVEEALEALGYEAGWQEEDGHRFLSGTWNGFPVTLEEPVGLEGWLLVTGDATDPYPSSRREELGASANDWNRDKFFPTVAVADFPEGVRVRALYAVELRDGVSDTQLRVHLDRALSSCTQALEQVVPLLPEP